MQPDTSKGLISNLSAYGYSASEISAAPGQYKLSIWNPFSSNSVCGRFRTGFDLAEILIPNSIATSFKTLTVNFVAGSHVTVTLLDGSTPYSISAAYSNLPQASAVGLDQSATIVVGGQRGVVDVKSMDVTICGTTCATPACSGSTTAASTSSSTGSGGPTSNAPQSSALPTPSTTTSTTAHTTSAVPCSGSGNAVPAQPVCVHPVNLVQGETFANEGISLFSDPLISCCSACCSGTGFDPGEWSCSLCKNRK